MSTAIYTDKNNKEWKTKKLCLSCNIPLHPKCSGIICKDCHHKQKLKNTIDNNVKELLSFGYKNVEFLYLDKNGHNVFKCYNPICNHFVEMKMVNFRSLFNNYGNLSCATCNTEIKRNKLSQRNREWTSPIAIEKFRKANERRAQEARERRKSKEFLDRKNYYTLVSLISNANFKTYYDEINPLDLPRGREYHLDHIVPIDYCFKNNIAAELCASKENLRMLIGKENVSKGAKLINEAEELLKRWQNMILYK